jgi:hypothetical protein
MFLLTLCVKTKSKFSVPSAGWSIPWIFCSTHGPTMTLLVLPWLIVCHGHWNLMCGRCTLMPIRCSANESAPMVTQATALRKISPISPITMVQVSQRGIRRRRWTRGNSAGGGPGGRAAASAR